MATKKKAVKKVAKNKISIKKKVAVKNKVATKKKVAVKNKVAAKKKVAVKNKVAAKKKVAVKNKVAAKKKVAYKTIAKQVPSKQKPKAPVINKTTKSEVKKTRVSLTKPVSKRNKAQTSKTITKSGKLRLVKQEYLQLDPTVLKIRERLIVNRGELLNSIQASQSVERNTGDLTFSNEIDLASSLEGREMIFQLTSRDRNEFKLIEEALFRINNSSYGECESCEKKISLKRLQIMPLTSLCIECQEAAENP